MRPGAGGCRETATASQPVHPQPRPSRGVVAASGGLAVGADRHPLLPGSRPARRGGPVRFDLPGRPARARQRRLPGRPHLARARHRAGGRRGRDPKDRADRHVLDHLHRAVQPGAAVRLARSHQQRPHRLEHRHLVAGDGGGQFQRRRPGEPRRALCARRGIRRRGQGAVGQLGRGRGDRRPRARTLCEAGSHPADQPQGRALPGRGSAQPATHAARPPRVRASRLVRYRPSLRGAARRGGVHRASREGDRAGFLRRPQGLYRGGRPLARARAHPSRFEPDDRRDRGRGAASRARDRRPVRSRGRPQASVRPLRRP